MQPNIPDGDHNHLKNDDDRSEYDDFDKNDTSEGPLEIGQVNAFLDGVPLVYWGVVIPDHNEDDVEFDSYDLIRIWSHASRIMSTASAPEAARG